MSLVCSPSDGDFLAAALVKKLKAASAGRAESAQALNDLSEGNTAEQVAEWEELERRVRFGRLNDNDLMEVYDLKVEKGKVRMASWRVGTYGEQRRRGLGSKTISSRRNRGPSVIKGRQHGLRRALRWRKNS